MGRMVGILRLELGGEGNYAEEEKRYGKSTAHTPVKIVQLKQVE